MVTHIGPKEVIPNTMRKYEALYIVSPKLNESEVTAIAEKFKKAAEENGAKVSKAQLWEKRKFAYEINHMKEGNYIIMEFESETSVPNELNRLMRISDDVIRHRIFALETA